MGKNTLFYILDTCPNKAFNDAFDLIKNPVISSAVVAGPPVECCRPIRWTEGCLTHFQGHGCDDVR